MRRRLSHGQVEARVAPRLGSLVSARVLVERRHCPLFDGRSDPMSSSVVVDAAGRRRSPATLPGHHAGRVPRNKGQRYPADPPTVEEIIAVMRQTRDDRHGFRVRALIVVPWRAGLRVQDALALAEPDLDERRGSLLVRSGKGGRRREIGMDAWAGSSCVRGSAPAPICRSARCSASSTARPAVGRGRAAAVRLELHRLPLQAGVRRRFAPHQLRHAHAIELAREGIAPNIIQRQLGHANLGTTSIYLQGIDTEEIIATVHARRGPMMSATAGLQL